jgi:hypothetical protein
MAIDVVHALGYAHRTMLSLTPAHREGYRVAPQWPREVASFDFTPVVRAAWQTSGGVESNGTNARVSRRGGIDA